MKNKINLLGIMLLTAMFSLFVIPNIYAVGGTVTIRPATSGYVNNTYEFSTTLSGLADGGNETYTISSVRWYLIYSNNTQRIIATVVNTSANQSTITNNTVNLNAFADGTYSFRARVVQFNTSVINSSDSTSVINDNTNPTVTVQYPTSLGDTMWGPSDDFEFTPTETNLANCTLNSNGVFSTQTSLTSGSKTTVSRTFTESNTSTWYVQCSDYTGHKVNSSAVTYNVVFGALGTPVISAGTPTVVTPTLDAVTSQLKGTAIPGTQITWWIIIIIGIGIIILWKPVISKILK